MKKSMSLGQQIASWIPFASTLLLFVYAVALRNSVPMIAEESSEVVQTATYLDSPGSLKTLLTSLDRHVQYAVVEWEYALNMTLFALFLVTAVAACFWFMYLAAQRKVNQLIEAQQKEEE